jgi:hypothetical protein
MATYKIRAFCRFARKHRITDHALALAAAAVREGNTDADLGGGLFKQRLARAGGGKSGGFRVVVAYRRGEHLFFLLGFAKNDRATLQPLELAYLKKYANRLDAMTRAQLNVFIEEDELEEITTWQ